MSSMLENLGIQTSGLTKVDKPFSSWAGSPINTWDFSMSMLNMGDLTDIAKLTINAGPIEASYLSKIYLLAKSLKTINNQPVVTEEDIEQYNKEHNLTGTYQVNIFEYKVLFIRKWSEPIVNRLAHMYDEMQDEYLATHFGAALPDALKAANFQGVDLGDTIPPSDEQNGNKSDGDHTPNTT